MTPKRKKVEEMILKTMSLMEPEGTNKERYQKQFTAMSDKEFDTFMKELRDKKRQLTLLAPNMKVVLKQKNLMAAADYVNAEIFTRVTYTDPVSGLKYTPKHQVIVLTLPVRRVRQYLHHGISVPEGDKHVDSLTGQVMKPDQSARFSFIEMQILYGRGMTETIKEYMKIRGGDIHAYAAFKQQLEETGTFRQSSLDTNTVTRSVLIASLILKCMGIENNILDDNKESTTGQR